MNDTWTRRLLLAAAAWNIAGAVISLVDPAGHYAQMYTTGAPARPSVARRHNRAVKLWSVHRIPFY